ncbi:hypothetical protein Vadar_028284 [Vaccinium darrowii]|uniref:Uncharacterized protein n=1 Tax=Vaccinium darrowii TaxID=229202 RepID=A0ACB7XTX9_9ERIC|nr:hypothetical protein Vadar_028284 [Vaccinium darrowii]
MASSVSTLPWIWVIEALASFKQVDASILIDLVKRTPEISDDLGKNAREMVSLRILESFFARQSASKNGGCAPDSKIELDPSKRCEDVVRHILDETSASNTRMDEPEMLKWDVQTFILHKRASLPKCTLLQLKGAILEGNHPILASLKECSGLSLSNHSGNRMSMDDGDLNPVAGGDLTSPTAENLDGLLQEDAAKTTLLPSKRDRSDLDTDDLAAKYNEDGISMVNGPDSPLCKTKKLKQDATFTGQAVDQNFVPVIENEFPEDLHGRNGQQFIRNDGDLAKSSHVGGSQESTFSEDCHDHYVALKRRGQSNGEDTSGLLLNHPQNSCHNDTVPEDSCGDELQRDLPREAKDNGKQCAEMGTSTASPLNGTQQNKRGDESGDKCENAKINACNGAPLSDGTHGEDIPDDAKEEMEHNPTREMSSNSDGYQDEKIDVALKKRTFLSSQCTISQDSLATADCTELNLCMKCNKGGQLLVCSGSACPLVVHQSCLGSAPRFDDRGKYYCPFCAYSHVISEYLEIKKKAALARNDLAVFIGLENGHRVDKHTRKLLVPEQNQLILGENANGNNQVNYAENNVNEVNSTLSRGNMEEDKKQMEPSVSRVSNYLPCQEEGVPTMDDGTLGALPEREREGRKPGPQCQSGNALEKQRVEEGRGCDRGDDNSTCSNRDSGHETKGGGEDVMQKEVLQPPGTDSNRHAAQLPNIDVGESSEEENDKATSNYRIKRRRHDKQEKQYTYPAIPQLRRKKVSWTSAEENILKEGIKKFSSIQDRNIPWKRILEFGSDVFQKGRTTIDLKDKWRNICKGSPKSK